MTEQMGRQPVNAGDELDLYLDAKIAKCRTGIARQVWLIGGLFLVLMGLTSMGALLLIPASAIRVIQEGVVPPGAGEADYIKLFTPVLIIAFGLGVGLLGLRRLEHFDTEMANLRRDLKDDARADAKQAESERATFRTNIERRLDEIKESIEVAAEQYAAQAIDSRKKHLLDTIGDWQKKTDEQIEQIRNNLQPYEWLRERQGEINDFSEVLSIGVAHSRVTEFFRKKEIDVAIRIAGHAIAHPIPGDPDDFHNLAAELARNNQEPMAAQIIDRGLQLHPKSVDMLADGIKYRSSAGDLDLAEQHYESLRKIGYSLWNWRAFTFSGDFLVACGRIDEAMAIYKEFAKQLPDDERAYSQPGVYYRRLGRLDRATEILEAGRKNCRRCAQCAITLSEIYCMKGDYEEAIKAANRAIEANAEDQPSANEAAIFWHRAAAEDSLVHKVLDDSASAGRPVSMDDVILMARYAVADYRMAMESLSALPHYQFRGSSRIQALRLALSRRGVEEPMLSDVCGPDDASRPHIDPAEFLSMLKRMRESGLGGTDDPKASE